MLNAKSRQVRFRPLSRESYRDIARCSSLRDVQDTAASMLPYVGRNYEQPQKLAVWHLLVASCRLTCSIQRVAGGRPELSMVMFVVAWLVHSLPTSHVVSHVHAAAYSNLYFYRAGQIFGSGSAVDMPANTA